MKRFIFVRIVLRRLCQMSAGKKWLIIDTDPGIDDASAICWMLRQKNYEIKALTVTHGNIGLEGCTLNALRILETAGRMDIPVYKGAGKPLFRPRVHAAYAHGQDGMGDLNLPLPSLKAQDLHASLAMISIIRESPSPAAILAIGPITNVALALMLDPEIAQKIEQIVFMGGAVRVPGNVTPAASFNVYADPEAAAVVYRSGIKVVQIGLDVCNQFAFYPEDFELLEKSGKPDAVLISRMAQFRLRQTGPGHTSHESVARESSIALNDVPAAAYLINPEWFQTVSVPGDIATEGICAGQTLLDPVNREKKKENVVFAFGADADDARRQWVSDLINL